MKPPRFDYLAPGTLDEALAILAERGEDAKVLAGGQSLVPLLNFRLVRPACLVDLNEVPGLDAIRPHDGGLAIGAMARQRAVETSALVRERCGLLAEAMPQIGHVQIRNRGTIGGSLVHGDPAAELPAVVAALDGVLVLRSARGDRVLRAEQFFVAYLATATLASELLVEVRLPALPPRTGSAFLEVSRRQGDFALVGVAATVTLDEAGVCTGSAIALTGVGPTPVVVREASGALVGAKPSAAAFEDAARRVRAAVRPESDLHASREYRQHVGGVLARRALTLAVRRAASEGSLEGAAARR